MHVVCGTDGEYLWIITAYYPSKDKWENDFKTKKGIIFMKCFYCKSDMIESTTTHVAELKIV